MYDDIGHIITLLWPIAHSDAHPRFVTKTICDIRRWKSQSGSHLICESRVVFLSNCDGALHLQQPPKDENKGNPVNYGGNFICSILETVFLSFWGQYLFVYFFSMAKTSTLVCCMAQNCDFWSPTMSHPNMSIGTCRQVSSANVDLPNILVSMYGDKIMNCEWLSWMYHITAILVPARCFTLRSLILSISHVFQTKCDNTCWTACITLHYKLVCLQQGFGFVSQAKPTYQCKLTRFILLCFLKLFVHVLWFVRLAKLLHSTRHSWSTNLWSQFRKGSSGPHLFPIHVGQLSGWWFGFFLLFTNIVISKVVNRC